MPLHDPLRRTERLIEESAGDDVVIYDRDTDRVIALDATDARLWRASDETRSVADLAALAELTEAEAATSLQRFADAGLMAETGMSRRGMLTKAGLVGAGVGVAGFASILAPVAAHAGSVPPIVNIPVIGVNLPPIITIATGVVISFQHGIVIVPPVIGTGFAPSTAVSLLFTLTHLDGTKSTKSVPTLTNDDGSLFVPTVKIPNATQGATVSAVVVAAGKTLTKPLTQVLGH